MKILMVNKFHYRKGGAETCYFTLAQALRQRGHQVVCFSMLDERNEPCEQSEFFVSKVDYNDTSMGLLKKLRIGVKLIYSVEAARSLKRLLEQEKPELAILHSVHRQLTLSIVDVLHEYGIPIFFIVHDAICICPNYTLLSRSSLCEKCVGGHFLNCVRQKCVKASFSKSLLAAAEAYFYKWRKTYTRVDRYFVPSVFLAEKLRQSDFTDSPIIPLRNPLPVETVFRIADQTEDSFLYFGRLSPEKGLITLLRAVRQLRGEAGICLRIVGDGSQREELERFVRENQLSDRITFTGFLTGEELWNTVERCRAVILPSEWQENAPYSVMEAMAKGRPCIVSSLGGLPELVEDGKNGFAFEARNVGALCAAIRKLRALNPSEYTQMCNCALKKAEELFCSDDYIDRLVLEYQLCKQERKI